MTLCWLEAWSIGEGEKGRWDSKGGRGGRGERRACGAVCGCNTVWCGEYVIPPPSLQVELLSTAFSLQCRVPSHHQLHLPRPLLPEMAPQGYVGQLVEVYVE